jgi:EAL domain-containing protein (putative c-di-GMP-specific phosphodiesterase class I)
MNTGVDVDGTIKNLLKGLQKDVVRRGSAEEALILEPLLDALANGHVGFEAEPWNSLDPDQPVDDFHQASEMLLRARMSDGAGISPEAPVKILNKLHLNHKFDLIIALLAVDQAVKKGDGAPFSFNISSRNACDATSLRVMDRMLRKHFGALHQPAHTIIELLEDDPANDVNVKSLEWAHKQGYQFAIDDATFDDPRLKNLGLHIDIVKVDREVSEMMMRNLDRGHREEREKISTFFNSIAEHAPQATILLEGIPTATMALRLKKEYSAAANISLVQGRYLEEPKQFHQHVENHDRMEMYA